MCRSHLSGVHLHYLFHLYFYHCYLDYLNFSTVLINVSCAIGNEIGWSILEYRKGPFIDSVVSSIHYSMTLGEGTSSKLFTISKTMRWLIVRQMFSLVIGPSSILLGDDPTRYIFLWGPKKFTVENCLKLSRCWRKAFPPVVSPRVTGDCVVVNLAPVVAAIVAAEDVDPVEPIVYSGAVPEFVSEFHKL